MNPLGVELIRGFGLELDERNLTGIVLDDGVAYGGVERRIIHFMKTNITSQ